MQAELKDTDHLSMSQQIAGERVVEPVFVIVRHQHQIIARFDVHIASNALFSPSCSDVWE